SSRAEVERRRAGSSGFLPMGSLLCDAYRRKCFRTRAGLARSRTMRPPVEAYGQCYAFTTSALVKPRGSHNSTAPTAMRGYFLAGMKENCREGFRDGSVTLSQTGKVGKNRTAKARG